MQFEVEQKFEVPDHLAVRRLLSEMDTRWNQEVIQIDRYFAHPARDFGKTDEALRIRSVGEQNYVTYKGPKVDATTKTRREIELPLSDGQDAQAEFAELLAALGFRPALVVEKKRQPGELHWENHTVLIALDSVVNLGTFVELEVTCDERSVDNAKRAVGSLAEELALTQSQRLSYLELLLDKQ